LNGEQSKPVNINALELEWKKCFFKTES